jgi:hypothetical protein
VRSQCGQPVRTSRASWLTTTTSHHTDVFATRLPGGLNTTLKQQTFYDLARTKEWSSPADLTVGERYLRNGGRPEVLIGGRLAVRGGDVELVANLAVRAASREGDEGGGDVIGRVLAVLDGDAVPGGELLHAYHQQQGCVDPDGSALI